MKRFELDDIMNTLIEHGVNCVETFCSLTESDFEEIGLNIGQRRKCILAAERIKIMALVDNKCLIWIQTSLVIYIFCL